jgi:hypothetical protein
MWTQVCRVGQGYSLVCKRTGTIAKLKTEERCSGFQGSLPFPYRIVALVLLMSPGSSPAAKGLCQVVSDSIYPRYVPATDPEFRRLFSQTC